MRSMISLVLAVCAGLAVTGSANGGLSLDFDSPEDAGAGLYRYTVRLVADPEADTALAWDGGFSGPINQVLALGEIPTPTLTYAAYLSAANRAIDTHFLFYDTALISARSPSESNTSLDGAFGLASGYPLQDLALAQIIVPSGETVDISGVAANAEGTVFSISGSITGGQEGLGLSVQRSDANDDGQPDYLPGEPIQVMGNATSNYEFVVWRIFEDQGLEVAGIVLRTTDPQFTFTPQEPGRYLIEVDSMTDGGWGCTPQSVSLTVIPEPATLGLMLAGALGLLRRR